MTTANRMRRAGVGALLILTLVAGTTLTSCARGSRAERAIAVPPAASRTPDLTLPLSEDDVNRIYYLASGEPPPAGRWESLDSQELKMAVASVAPETKRHFDVILGEVSTLRFGNGVTGSRPATGLQLPTAHDLGAGRIGNLFDPKGATDEALDTRLVKSRSTGDILVGRFPGNDKVPPLYFAFYRYYPELDLTKSPPMMKDVKSPGDGYARLVVFAEKSTERMSAEGVK